MGDPSLYVNAATVSIKGKHTYLTGLARWAFLEPAGGMT